MVVVDDVVEDGFGGVTRCEPGCFCEDCCNLGGGDCRPCEGGGEGFF